MTGAKFDLRERLYEYLKANKLSLTKFLDTNGVAYESVNALIRNGDEGLLGKRLQTLKLILSGIGCTFDDYDPRIMQGFCGARRIERAIDRGTSVWSICNYTGISGHSSMRIMLDALRDNELERITYNTVLKFAKADCDDFDAYAADHLIEYQTVRSVLMFDESGKRMNFGVGALTSARKLGDAKAGKTLLTRISGTLLTPNLVREAEYDADADMLRFQSATGLYRFEVTKHELVAIWANTGEVSMRRAVG